MVDGRETPPSLNLSKGGVVYRQRKHPLHLTFRAREGMVVCRWKEHPLHLTFQAREGGWWEGNPSVSHFKRGRGWLLVARKPPPSHNLSEGGGQKEHEHPLHLAFRAREGESYSMKIILNLNI